MSNAKSYHSPRRATPAQAAKNGELQTWQLTLSCGCTPRFHAPTPNVNDVIGCGYPSDSHKCVRVIDKKRVVTSARNLRRKHAADNQKLVAS